VLRTERQSAPISKIKNGGLDHYGAGPFEQQQYETVGVEGVKIATKNAATYHCCSFLANDRWTSVIGNSNDNHAQS